MSKRGAPVDATDGALQRKRIFDAITVANRDIKKRRINLRTTAKKSKSLTLVGLYMSIRVSPVKKIGAKIKEVRHAMVVPVFPDEAKVDSLSENHASENGGYYDSETQRYYVAVKEKKKQLDELGDQSIVKGAPAPVQAFQQQSDADSPLDPDSADALCVQYKEVFPLRPISVVVWDEFGVAGSMGVCRYVSAAMHESRASLSCSSIDSGCKLTHSLLYTLMEHMPPEAFMVPNPRTCHQFLDTGVYIKVDPINPVVKPDMSKPSGVVFKLDVERCDPLPNRQSNEAYIGVSITGHAMMWETDIGIKSSITSSLRSVPFNEAVMIDVSVWNTDIVDMFGVGDEVKWANVVCRYAMLTPMIVSCTVNEKASCNNMYSVGPQDSLFAKLDCDNAAVSLYSHAVYSKARWVIKNATIPVTVDFVRTCALGKKSAQKGAITASTVEACSDPFCFFAPGADKLRRTKFTTKGLRASIACLSMLGDGKTAKAIKKVESGQGTLRIMANTLVTAADVASGVYKNMTPDQGVAHLTTSVPQDVSRKWNFVLYYISNKSERKIAERSAKAFTQLNDALGHMRLKFDKDVFMSNGYLYPVPQIPDDPELDGKDDSDHQDQEAPPPAAAAAASASAAQVDSGADDEENQDQ